MNTDNGLHFRGRVALVAGGTGDIGRCVVRRLSAAGLQVAFTYHSNQEAAKALETELGGAVRGWAVAENRLETARRIAAEVREWRGPADYLANCAGHLHDLVFARMEEAEWREVLDANLDAAFFFSRALIFDQLKQQQGAMVHVSSIAALTGSVGQANYAAAKAGVLGLVKSLAREAGHFGVRVNAVAPGYVTSRMTASLPDRIRDWALQTIPLGRFGEPDEIAAAVVWLLSDEARYINGQVLVVDGGLVT
ncbi:MAG: SDR family oxidoreductase [candidate division FCPU426 bacterium]